MTRFEGIKTLLHFCHLNFVVGSEDMTRFEGIKTYLQREDYQLPCRSEDMTRFEGIKTSVRDCSFTITVYIRRHDPI